MTEAARFDLSGQGMCLRCIDGAHREPCKTATSAIVAKDKGPAGSLCQCPCHRSTLDLKSKAKPKRKPQYEAKLTDHAPMLYIDAKS